MGKKQPKAPDPAETAAAQGNINRNTAITQQLLNQTNQVTPYGSLEYSQTGSNFIDDPNGQTYYRGPNGEIQTSAPMVNSGGTSRQVWDGGQWVTKSSPGKSTPATGWSQVKGIYVPQYTATQTLSPSQQAIFDQTQGASLNLATVANEQSGRIGKLLNDPFTYNNQDAEKWAYDLAQTRIAPQQEQARKALDTQLLNRGIRPGSDAYDQEMQRLTNANTDQNNQLALSGRGQAFQEQLALRNQPLNEIIGLMSGTQIQNPNSTFAQTPQSQVAGVDYTGLVNQKYQGELAQYNAKTGALGGLFGSIASAIPWSDRRLKEDIRRVGVTDGGIPIYTYRYIGDPVTHMGVMAQEAPDARVLDEETGYYRVDYRKVH